MKWKEIEPHYSLISWFRQWCDLKSTWSNYIKQIRSNTRRIYMNQYGETCYMFTGYLLQIILMFSCQRPIFVIYYLQIFLVLLIVPKNLHQQQDFCQKIFIEKWYDRNDNRDLVLSVHPWHKPYYIIQYWLPIFHDKISTELIGSTSLSDEFDSTNVKMCFHFQSADQRG